MPKVGTAPAAVPVRLRERGFGLFEIQWRNEHTKRLGAVEVPRAEYLRRLGAAATLA